MNLVEYRICTQGQNIEWRQRLLTCVLKTKRMATIVDAYFPNHVRKQNNAGPARLIILSGILATQPQADRMLLVLFECGVLLGLI